ncbi:MAG: DUF1579 family protein [Gemmatimonadaceae bacterium]
MPDVTRPGPAHRRLDPLVGAWDVSTRFGNGTGPERIGRARAQAIWTLDGRVLRQDFTAESGLVVMQLIGFDTQRGTYYVLRFDNLDTGVLHAEGSASADGRTISAVGDRVDPLTGKVAPLRIVLTVVDSNRFNVEWYARQQDGSELRTALLEHTRRR